MKEIFSYAELNQNIKDKDKSFLLLHKKGSTQSDCAFKNLSEAVNGEIPMPVFFADVNIVKDIHEKFGVKSVPSFIVFEKEEFKTVIKGCHDTGFYKSGLRNAIYQAKAKAEGKKTKRVVVYSTPACSWCNTLKAWLRRNGISFSDIDVSKSESAAQELVRKTGQQGVPQTEINGQIVVGFDEARLKKLLEI